MERTWGEIVSLNVGLPKLLECDGQEVMSGICKNRVDAPLYLSKEQLEGDAQADRKYHGGPDKAICVYSYDHYPYWEQTLERSLPEAAFGENVTVAGLLEDEVCIGDIFQLGEAVVQVTQPRQPCHKLAKRYGIKDLAIQVQNTGYTGFYFRVLQEGVVAPSDKLVRKEQHSMGISVAFANQIMHHEKQNQEGMKQLLSVDALSTSWKNTMTKRLGGESTPTAERLEGTK